MKSSREHTSPSTGLVRSIRGKCRSVRISIFVISHLFLVHVLTFSPIHRCFARVQLFSLFWRNTAVHSTCCLGAGPRSLSTRYGLLSEAPLIYETCVEFLWYRLYFYKSELPARGRKGGPGDTSSLAVAGTATIKSHKQISNEVQATNSITHRKLQNIKQVRHQSQP